MVETLPMAPERYFVIWRGEGPERSAECISLPYHPCEPAVVDPGAYLDCIRMALKLAYENAPDDVREAEHARIDALTHDDVDMPPPYFDGPRADVWEMERPGHLGFEEPQADGTWKAQ